MSKLITGERRVQCDEAVLHAVTVHGVPVKVLARALCLTRQTVYRRMQRARINMRRAAAQASDPQEQRPSGQA
jgi:transcriptional regulator of acetoin/glycerol metabolism